MRACRSVSSYGPKRARSVIWSIRAGTFDAADDLDRLVTVARGPMRYVHPYGHTMFNRSQCADLLADINQFATTDNVTPLEQSALDRLRVMTERCRDSADDLYLWFIGG
jgi:hypothetical protein